MLCSDQLHLSLVTKITGVTRRLTRGMVIGHGFLQVMSSAAVHSVVMVSLVGSPKACLVLPMNASYIVGSCFRLMARQSLAPDYKQWYPLVMGKGSIHIGGDRHPSHDRIHT